MLKISQINRESKRFKLHLSNRPDIWKKHKVEASAPPTPNQFHVDQKDELKKVNHAMFITLGKDIKYDTNREAVKEKLNN